MFFTVSPLFMSNSDRELTAPVTLYKRATVSTLLLSLMTKEQQERFALFHGGIALLLIKNERFARKTNERIPNSGTVSLKQH